MSNLNADEGAQYVNGLLATCQDPQVRTELNILTKLFKALFLGMTGFLWTRSSGDVGEKDDNNTIWTRNKVRAHPSIDRLKNP